MKTVILTDDTKSQFPSHNRWSNRFGMGSSITKNPSFKNLLEIEKITIPTDDFENEEMYKKILHEYIRPAKNMFGGRFSDIRTLEEQLKKISIVKIWILSGRYGLLDSEKEIVPYDYSIKNETRLKSIDRKFKVFQNFKDILSDATYFIILLPKVYVKYLFKLGFFDNLPPGLTTLVVSSKDFKKEFENYKNIHFFERKGVARLKSQNCDQIFSLINKKG